MKMNQEQGVTAVEYGLIAALISVVIILAVTLTGINTKKVFCVVATELAKTLSLSDNGNCSGSGSNSGDDSSSDGDSSSSSIDPNYIDTSLGGNATPDTDSIMQSSTFNDALSETLASLNASDPIKSAYGFYDNNNEPLTSYNDIQSDLNDETNVANSTLATTLENNTYQTEESEDVNGEKPTGTSQYDQVYQQKIAQVQTASGKVYTIATESYYDPNTGNNSILTYTIDSNNNVGNIVEKSNDINII